MQRYDLVLVENNCFLEPTYVVIEGLPKEISIDQARSNYYDIAQGVVVKKLNPKNFNPQQTCKLVFHFHAN